MFRVPKLSSHHHPGHTDTPCARSRPRSGLRALSRAQRDWLPLRLLKMRLAGPTDCCFSTAAARSPPPARRGWWLVWGASTPAVLRFCWRLRGSRGHPHAALTSSFACCPPPAASRPPRPAAPTAARAASSPPAEQRRTPGQRTTVLAEHAHLAQRRSEPTAGKRLASSRIE